MIVLLLANGFEEIEALTPIDVLKRAGLEIVSCGLFGSEVRGSHGITVIADTLPEDIDLTRVDMVILPGGMPGATNIDSHPFTDKIIDATIERGGRLAAICAAPLVLGRRGLLEGKMATCYPGFEEELRGATVTDKGVVTDGSITTAKGMGVALEFAKELVRLMVGEEKVNEISSAIMEN